MGGLQIPRYYNMLCSTKSSASLWTGNAPARHSLQYPTGNQITVFTISMHRYQAYCAKHNFLSMPLYEDTEVRPSPAFSEEHMKTWSERLFNEWLVGDLYLPLTD